MSADKRKQKIMLWLPACLWGLLILTVSSIPGPRLPSDPFFGFDKCAHGLEYFIFTIIILVTLRKQQMRKCSVKELYWIVGFIACFALFDEVHQMAIPGRFFSWYDFAADVSGALIATGVVSWVSSPALTP